MPGRRVTEVGHSEARQHAVSWPTAKWLNFAGRRAPATVQGLVTQPEPSQVSLLVAQIRWHGTTGMGGGLGKGDGEGMPRAVGGGMAVGLPVVAGIAALATATDLGRNGPAWELLR